VDKPHKKLEVWKLAMELVIETYRLTESFPAKETYGLTNQIRRAVVSVPSNMAEGAARQTRKEFVNFLHMAQGSLSELDTQVEIARRVGYLDEKDWETLDIEAERIDKMISGLIRQQTSTHTSPLTPHA